MCHHCYIERSGSTNCRGRWKHRSTTPQHHVTRCSQMIWSAHAQMLNCCRMHLALMHPALRLLSVSDIFSFHSLLMLLHCLNATSFLPFSPFLSFVVLQIRFDANNLMLFLLCIFMSRTFTFWLWCCYF